MQKPEELNSQSKPSALFESSVVLTSNKYGCLSVSRRYRNLSVQKIRPGDEPGDTAAPQHNSSSLQHPPSRMYNYRACESQSNKTSCLVSANNFSCPRT